MKFNPSKRHAYLIICHDNFILLNRLIKALDDERNDIYILCDKKAKCFKEGSLRANIHRSKLYFVPRINISWGGFSMIEAEVKLMKEAALNGPYQYYHLLSGVDYPIKSQDYIHRFFDNNDGKEFISIWGSVVNSQPNVDRIKYYYPFQDKFGTTIKNNRLFSFAQKFLVTLQKIADVDRIKDFQYGIYKGPNWFSISESCVQYVLSHTDYIEQYKSTFCADEIFLQTLIMNSPLKNNVENNCLREIDWKRGFPYCYHTNEDFDLLKTSSQLFARKFDEIKSFNLIEKIDKEINTR